jgi:hypothetical protein
MVSPPTLVCARLNPHRSGRRCPPALLACFGLAVIAGLANPVAHAQIRIEPNKSYDPALQTTKYDPVSIASSSLDNKNCGYLLAARLEQAPDGLRISVNGAVGEAQNVATMNDILATPMLRNAPKIIVISSNRAVALRKFVSSTQLGQDDQINHAWLLEPQQQTGDHVTFYDPLRTGRPAFVLSVGAADEQAYHLLPHDNVVVWVNCTPFRKDQTPTITSGFGISRLCATVFARWLFSLYQQPYFWMVDDNVAFVTGLPDNLQDLEQPAINVNVPFLGFAPDNDRKLREPEDPNNKDNLLKILRPNLSYSSHSRDSSAGVA